ncbi:MAG: hypothetical protein JRD89_02255 [Deltaproteobacteria bacterium]|nr:hypothetical protein [Deltaproteobacteria bacterium]
MARVDVSWNCDRRRKHHLGPRGTLIHGYLSPGPRGGEVRWYAVYWRQRFYGKHRRLMDAKVAAAEVLRKFDLLPGSVCPAKHFLAEPRPAASARRSTF